MNKIIVYLLLASGVASHTPQASCIHNGEVLPIGGTSKSCTGASCFLLICAPKNQGGAQLQTSGCIAFDGKVIPIGSTTEVFHGDLGFVYSCIKNGNSVEYTPTGCATAVPRVQVPEGGKLVHNENEYNCNATIGMIGNNRYYCGDGEDIKPLGSSTRYCQDEHCKISTCLSQKSASAPLLMKTTRCTFGEKFVEVGGQFIWKNKLCTCESEGFPNCLTLEPCTDSLGEPVKLGASTTIWKWSHTVSIGYSYICEANIDYLDLKPIGCAIYGVGSVAVGSTINFGLAKYLCSVDDNGDVSLKLHSCIFNGKDVSIGATLISCSGSSCFSLQCSQDDQGGVQFLPNGCLASNGSVISAGSSLKVFHGNLGFVYSCIQNRKNATSIEYKATGCISTNGDKVIEGEILIHNERKYVCNFKKGFTGVKPSNCHSGEDVISLGGSIRKCDGHMCSIQTCYSTDKQSKLMTRGCVYGMTFVHVGSQNFWQNQRCTCEEKVPKCSDATWSRSIL